MLCTAERSQGAPLGHTRYEVADVVRLCGAEFSQTHALSYEQGRALHDIEVCRTAVLGGHLDVCQQCGHSRPSYNSCRNRHCPKCQALRQARWVHEREQRFLPTHHFHVVFTLPAPLRALVLRYRTVLFDMLFACAAETLLDLGRDKLGAELGLTAVLHTWTRDLNWHPHVHCIVSGGGLDLSNDQWVPTSKKFLFPVLVLGEVFRGKFLAALRVWVEHEGIDLGCADPVAFFRDLYSTRWVIYAKRPFGDLEHVVRYLGRYTHRVGISNARIVSVSPDAVCFRTKNGKCVTVEPQEFLRRFLLHVLPQGYTKIRHFGLLAPGNVNGPLERARAALSRSGAVPPHDQAPASPQTWIDILLLLTGVDLAVCPRCHARAMIRQPLPLPPSAPCANDTS